MPVRILHSSGDLCGNFVGIRAASLCFVVLRGAILQRAPRGKLLKMLNLSLPDTHARFLVRSTCCQVRLSIARIRKPVSTANLAAAFRCPGSSRSRRDLRTREPSRFTDCRAIHRHLGRGVEHFPFGHAFVEDGTQQGHVPVRGGLAGLGRLERAQFLHDLAGDRLNGVFVQMFIEPGEDRLVSALRALACLGEPANRRITPGKGRTFAEANLSPRARAS